MYRKGTDTLGFAAGGNDVFEVLTDKVRVSGSTHIEDRLYIETVDEFIYNGVPSRVLIWKDSGTPGETKGEVEFVSGCTFVYKTCDTPKQDRPIVFTGAGVYDPVDFYDFIDMGVKGPIFAGGEDILDTYDAVLGGLSNVFPLKFINGNNTILDTAGKGSGVVQIGITSGTISPGQLCYLSTTQGGGSYASTTRFALADADGSSTASSLLAVCMSGSTGNDQERPFLIDGYVTVNTSQVDNTGGGFADMGKPVYVSATAGKYDMNPPSSSGQIVRIVGHVTNIDGTKYTINFRPDNTWIEL